MNIAFHCLIQFSTSLKSPSQLAGAFAYPVLLVVVGFTLTLTLACATVGVNPIPLVATFLHDSTLTLLPLVSSLVLIWLFYALVYLVVVGSFHDILLIQRQPDRSRNISAAWRVLLIFSQQPKYSCCPLNKTLSTPLHTNNPVFPHMGWCPGIHPQLS